MAWVRNPFFKPEAVPPVGRLSDETDADVEARAQEQPPLPPPEDTEAGAGAEAEVGAGAGVGLPRMLRPTAKMTGYQFFYIFILDGIGAMILSGGINFAIAYAMYITQMKHPIRLFQLPNTLAGDAAVTIIIQCIITWLVELILVNRDLNVGQVAPIGFIRQPTGRLARWYMLLDRGQGTTTTTTEGGGEVEQRPAPGSLAHWALFLYSQVLRGFLVAIPSFCLLWGPCVGILTAVGRREGGDWVFERTWAPQVFKLLLGGVLGLLTTPFFAMFWLVRAGWALQTNGAVAQPVVVPVIGGDGIGAGDDIDAGAGAAPSDEQ